MLEFYDLVDDEWSFRDDTGLEVGILDDVARMVHENMENLIIKRRVIRLQDTFQVQHRLVKG